MMEFLSWDDDIPNIWKNKIHVPNHQPDKNMVRYLHICICLRGNKPKCGSTMVVHPVY